ncbi:SET and MYND domain-containing protein 4 isoform X2 [Temnothorax curvispinosus]|uniref:SET and MYND domain-containing protein 4 isoform X2 n=1 Tax=Temnothorax curvispinosus TaxID=300111 RepID=A0A6J1PCT2_9HYME|nr:SET and MYND domain-containing protein 4 isoform X2 [Temnothorax curvispinosus]
MQDQDEFYRTLCSSETLRSGRKGFFHDFSGHVMETAGDTWTSKIFGRIDDDEGRMRAVFTDAKVKDVVADTLAKVKPLFRDKDAEISRRRRLEGYQLGAVGEHDKALLLFSQAVLRAPQPGHLQIAEGISAKEGGVRAVFESQRDFSGAHRLSRQQGGSIDFGQRERLRAPVGCPHCSCVAFCGKKCKDVAMATYHKYECKVLALLIGSGMSVLSMVALRMVTQEGPQKCLKIYEELKKNIVEEAAVPLAATSTTTTTTTTTTTPNTHDMKLPASSKSAKRRIRRRKLKASRRGEEITEMMEEKGTKERRESDDDDESVDMAPYNLVTHADRRTSKDFLERSLMAAFLLKCLQRVGFFACPTPDDEVPGAEEITVAALLLRNLQLLQFNAHEFFETRVSAEHRFHGSRPVYLGVAIYPTVARFNHDCYPAVTRYFVGRHIVIRAVRGLRPGDVIAENYGPIFTKKTLAERQRTLAGRYWFRCTCKACQEDWPRFENLTNDSVRLRCPTAGCSGLHSQARQGKPIKCPDCQKKICLEDRLACLRECEALYDRGLAGMENERVDEAIGTLCGALKRFHQVACPPHRDTHLAEIALSSCLADYGNTWRPAAAL